MTEPTRLTPDWMGISTYPTPVRSGASQLSVMEVTTIKTTQMIVNPIKIYRFCFDSIYNIPSFLKLQ